MLTNSKLDQLETTALAGLEMIITPSEARSMIAELRRHRSASSPQPDDMMRAREFLKREYGTETGDEGAAYWPVQQLAREFAAIRRESSSPQETATPPAPDMEVVREWEEAWPDRNKLPTSREIRKLASAGNRMAAALSARARKIEGLERKWEDACEDASLYRVISDDTGRILESIRKLLGADPEDNLVMLIEGKLDDIKGLEEEATLAETQRDAAREALTKAEEILRSANTVPSPPPLRPAR